MKLAKSYQPSLYEDDIYSLWEKSAAFSVAKDKDQAFSLVVPPPNANGNLHMGHALTLAIEDIMARYHRQKGEAVLFVPGADHAGFETQVVFERELTKEGKSRFDYSREVLYDNIFAFVERNRDNYQSQIRKLGASVDWEHFIFSLDGKIIRQAYSTFRAMLEEGRIYRGERLVNFCTFHGTAFADIEIDYQEEKGKLWRISYPLTDGSGAIVVATTRPETLLGDTAVAVNPQDSRYSSFIGKTLKVPLTNREVPVIADAYVETKFGTGAVKITPAHDQNDYDMAERHDLPFITVIGFDGKINHNAPAAFQGLSVSEGREAVLRALEEQGFLEGSEDYTHNVAHCYKCGTVIEPLLKEQWFVATKPLAESALTELRAGGLTFIPAAKRKQLENYYSTIRDWNISRQIVWGVPIPAFVNEEDPGDWIYDERVDQEVIEVNNKTYRRDPDVFDTWFTSSSWPYAALDYPSAEEYQKFYPLSIMETGTDLLLPWVSRMIMLGLYVTGKLPFESVYLHGMITDSKGKKMSKSVGNVIDPMGLIDKYGSDALRIGVISGHSAGNSQPYIESKLVGGRNFCNKLWNVARYIEAKLETEPEGEYALTDEADHWVLARYQEVKANYVDLMDASRFSEAYEALYHFLWDELADWYIEASKLNSNVPLLKSMLEAVLVLAHPFAPFVSETIWQTLELNTDSLLMAQPLKELVEPDPRQAKQFALLKDLISSVRSLLKATAAKEVILYYHDEAIIEKNAALIKQLSGVKSVNASETEQGILIPGTNLNAWLDIDQKQIDNYLKNLEEQIKIEHDRISLLEQRLKNTSYLERAPKELVSETRAQLVEAEQNLENYLQEKVRFSSS